MTTTQPARALFSLEPELQKTLLASLSAMLDRLAAYEDPPQNAKIDTREPHSFYLGLTGIADALVSGLLAAASAAPPAPPLRKFFNDVILSLLHQVHPVASSSGGGTGSFDPTRDANTLMFSQFIGPLVVLEDVRANAAALPLDADIKETLLRDLPTAHAAAMCFLRVYGQAGLLDRIFKRQDVEVFYGRAGLAAAALALRSRLLKRGSADKNQQQQQIAQQLAAFAAHVVSTVEAAGQEQAEAIYGDNQHRPRVEYRWHNKAYCGAAHGGAGVLYTQLSAAHAVGDKNKMSVFLEDAMAFAQRAKCSNSSNFMSSISSRHAAAGDSSLVQFCHGAPGFLLLFSRALQVVASQSSESAAAWTQALAAAAECTATRGQIRDSVGLCHGSSGNGLTLLRAASVLQSAAFWSASVDFAVETCALVQKKVFLRADRTLSLHEGLAGAVSFVSQILLAAKNGAHVGGGIGGFEFEI